VEGSLDQFDPASVTSNGAQAASGGQGEEAGRGVSPGWYPDPTGRHEWRYFDGQVWTAHVADQGQASLDPIQ
jgi:hypothetical protein